MAQETMEINDCHMDFSDLDDAQLVARLAEVTAGVRDLNAIADEIAMEMHGRIEARKAAQLENMAA